ncbi:hypothetical protein [Gloeobacter morelensis]|uniref:Uncharacterized protein n=1 Tax=Gloeobacter morelensis MG652769 TaxID=2781736 RepID=A0ABY3PG05_9CYAN|nr:hypothetical protein [Gloeobacter morelensis]UFP92587.1 hypothetical protein ISF26_12095 [Gloeobacter morelensis MG652769]
MLDRWPAVAARLDERCLRNLVAYRPELRRIDQVLAMAMADAQPAGALLARGECVGDDGHQVRQDAG